MARYQTRVGGVRLAVHWVPCKWWSRRFRVACKQTCGRVWCVQFFWINLIVDRRPPPPLTLNNEQARKLVDAIRLVDGKKFDRDVQAWMER